MSEASINAQRVRVTGLLRLRSEASLLGFVLGTTLAVLKQC